MYNVTSRFEMQRDDSDGIVGEEATIIDEMNVVLDGFYRDNK